MEVNIFGPKELVVYREPSDMTCLVNKTSENLRELLSVVNIKKGVAYPKIEENAVEEIISALKELDEERLWIHETVEAETIKSSVLRHKLNNFPRETDWEIDAAVKVVRNSNKEIIQDYKKKIDETKKYQKELQDQCDMFHKTNEVLGEEQKPLRESYDDTLHQLNETLMKKSNMQIKLNNTREDIKEMRNKIKEFELAFVELNEDIITDRHESEAEQDALRKKIQSTVEKLDHQKKLNVEKEQNLNVVREKQHISAGNLAHAELLTCEEEEKNEALQSLFDKESQNLQEKMMANQNLKDLRDSVKLELQALCEQFEQEKEKLTQDIQNIISQLEVVRNEFTSLTKQKIMCEDKLETETRSQKQNEENVEDTMKKLRIDKEELLIQSAECSRLKKLNQETQLAILKVQQEHVAAAEILSKEIEHLTDSLEAEKIERQNLQEKRDLIIKEANEYVNDFNSFAAGKTRNINEGKTIFQNKSEEGRLLQKKLKEIESEMKSKQKELQTSKARYIQMQKDMKGQAKKLNQCITKLEMEISLLKEAYDSQLPGFNELQTAFAKQTKEFQQMKKVVVEVKTKKSDLESSVEDKLGKLNDMEGPKKKMIEDIQNLRTGYVQKLNEDNEEIKYLENEIYSTDQKLAAVDIQNNRFRKAIEYFESEIAFMDSRVMKMNDGKFQIDITTEEYRVWLEMQWRRHMELDKTYHDQDVLLLDDIKQVEEITSERERKILQIHGQLEEHLQALSRFIENVAHMRP